MTDNVTMAPARQALLRFVIVTAGLFLIFDARTRYGLDLGWMLLVATFWCTWGSDLLDWIRNRRRTGEVLALIESADWPGLARRDGLRKAALPAALIAGVGSWACVRSTWDDAPSLLWWCSLATLLALWFVARTPASAQVRDAGLSYGPEFWPWDWAKGYEWDGDLLKLRFFGSSGWRRWRVAADRRSAMDALLKRRVPAVRS